MSPDNVPSTEDCKCITEQFVWTTNRNYHSLHVPFLDKTDTVAKHFTGRICILKYAKTNRLKSHTKGTFMDYAALRHLNRQYHYFPTEVVKGFNCFVTSWLKAASHDGRSGQHFCGMVLLQVLGALTNPSLEHEITTAIMGKSKLAWGPVCTLNSQREELVFFSLWKW